MEYTKSKYLSQQINYKFNLKDLTTRGILEMTLQGNNNLVTEFSDQKLVVAICNRNSHQIPVVSDLRPK